MSTRSHSLILVPWVIWKCLVALIASADDTTGWCCRFGGLHIPLQAPYLAGVEVSVLSLSWLRSLRR